LLEAGGVVEEVETVGVKLSDSLVEPPELLVVTEGELGATETEAVANGTEVVLVVVEVHSDVVVVVAPITVVVALYYRRVLN
jgi:hypothetical protein